MQHRMADPLVRRRTALMLTAIGGLVYITVALLGRPGGAFTEVELPDVAGLPIPVPQIEDRLPPQAPALPGTSGQEPGTNP
jgi:hypothetical protein